MEISESLLIELQKSVQIGSGHFSTRSTEKLTDRQFTVLDAIDFHGKNRQKPSQMTIVTFSGIDRSTLADMVGRMMKKGWITRERSRIDGRAYELSLTDIGRQIVEANRPVLHKADASLSAPLSDTEKRTLMSLLKKINGTAAMKIAA